MPLNIDLHTHTFFSGDGVSSPEDNIAAARAKGLHGFAVTDHNTCDAITYLLEQGLMREDGLPVDGFLVIPGQEVTTEEGHLLCIGATIPDLKGRSARDVCEIIHERDVVIHRRLLEGAFSVSPARTGFTGDGEQAHRVLSSNA